MALKKDYMVQKRNVLNEIRANNMTVQELRFFSIYLSRINKNDTMTRVVRFPLKDFQRIMNYGRLNIAQLQATTNNLLCKVVNIPTDTGGYTGFQLFKRCRVDRDNNDEWYVEIDAHDDSLPLMFEFKEKYFSYKLWNALRLRSANQVRMYEILKQYERAGERIISIEELRELLGIGKKEYPQWERFRVRVLEACQKALSESTDIEFIYEPYGKRGPGGKILTLRFAITKNHNCIDQLTLDEFISIQDNEEPDSTPIRNRQDEIIELLSDACNNEFDKEQMQLILDLVLQIIPMGITGVGIEHHDYLFHQYKKLKYQAAKNKIHNHFEYLRAMIQAEI